MSQTNQNVIVALKRETTVGTVPATVTGATRLRILDSPGMVLDRAQIRSGEIRADGFQGMGRLGGKTASGSFNTEVHTGGATDLLLESILRSAFVTATSIGFATMTTVSIGSNTITAAGGDWVGGQGLRVGDVFTITGSGTAANNSLRTMITALSSTVITVATGTFVTGTAAAATGTITRLKKLVGGTTPTRTSYTIEQYDADNDLSETFKGCRLTGLSLSFKPGAPVTATWNFLGLDHTALATGTSPFYDTPSLTTTLPLIADDSTIRYNGSPITTLTGLDLNFAIDASGLPVIGSWTGPDIFDNECAISGSCSGLRADFSNLTLYDAETEFEIGIVLKEPTGTPPECLTFFLSRVKLAKVAAPAGGGTGAKVETRELMIAPKVAATGYDGTPVVICSSAA